MQMVVEVVEMKSALAVVRSYRVSTQISEEHGILLEKLQIQIRTECGKKQKVCELIEMAIESLESAETKEKA